MTLQPNPARLPPARQAAAPARQRAVAEITGMLRAVTGEDERWAAAVTEASRLEADLRMEGVEVTALGARLAAAYGERVDLAGYLASLSIYELLDLTVGDLAALVLGAAG